MTTQLNLFQHGEDLPLFNQPSDITEIGPFCPGCGEPLATGDGVETPALYCDQCGQGWDSPAAVLDIYATARRWGPWDDPAICQCGEELDEGLTLCRKCADEQIAELDESYKAGGISWEVYTQGVNICLERSGRLPR